MNVQSKISLDAAWKERLGIAHRRAPEFYESSEDLTAAQHASAIRAALDELGLSAVFCVQGVPTVGMLVVDHFDRSAIMQLHADLWNQGLISLLLVIAGDTLRAYSLMRTPKRDQDESFDTDCLIEILSTTTDALQFQNLIYGAESGRLWWEYQDKFRPKERVDQVLLDNLLESHRQLRNADELGAPALESEAAQALLIQTMFVAYLEDRGILTERYFEAVSEDQAKEFVSVLTEGNPKQLKGLFDQLRKDFNGNIFVAPCSFDPAEKAADVLPAHMKVLAEFRPGMVDMKGSQYRFWGYNFRYIPVELISAVYDRFLGEREAERRDKGAYYTPMFLADTVIAQVWDMLDDKAKDSGEFLDPACGSGIFLVRMFQRLCEHTRVKRARSTLGWPDLIKILQRLHGWDINGSAVRVAIFSLYVALLEEKSPPDIQKLIDNGRILPELWGQNLIAQDFFTAEEEAKFAVLIGNPPWSSRRAANAKALDWATQADLPLPSKEAAWGFTWKAMRHISPAGIVAFLLPAMGFLHNPKAENARVLLFTKTSVKRVINFSDLRFQLFEKALQPTALLIFGNHSEEASFQRFDYWVPKADLNLRNKRVLTLSSADKMSLSVEVLHSNPMVFKHRLWMREPDAKLFSYLDRLPKLGGLIEEFGALVRRKQSVEGKWVIGQGYKEEPDTAEDKEPFEGAQGREPPKKSDYVGTIPDLPIRSLTPIFQSDAGLIPANSDIVHRLGFETGFFGNRILVPRGVSTSTSRLRASYCTESLTFSSIIQAITIPSGHEATGKLLTAFLNSRLAAWFVFQGTASFGSGRPEVKQSELRKLPFPTSEDLPNPKKSQDAARELISVIDQAQSAATSGFRLEADPISVLQRIDQLTYEYFGLSDEEVALVEDGISMIVPSIQPHESNQPPLWIAPGDNDRKNYAEYLIAGLQSWVRTDEKINARLVARARDLAVLQLSFGSTSMKYVEVPNGSVSETLAALASQLHVSFPGNFQLIPDIRIFADDCLYLVKPMQMRFWMRSAALADADAIALDLQDAINMKRRASA